ncbi:phasin family protein [Fodinicurvata halophila]|uniref:Phasin family protein n=1 Tax=Fodinicurvata halophila TaxID=1419723 RepID=A0ABV8UFL3_9PROT
MKKDSVPTSQVREGVPADTVPAMNGQMAEAMLSATDICLKNFAAWQKEVSTFTQRRMTSNTRLLRSLPGCANWEEVMSLQQGWLKTTGEDYMDETGRMMNLSQRIVDGLYAAAVEEAAEVARSVSTSDDGEQVPMQDK